MVAARPRSGSSCATSSAARRGAQFQAGRRAARALDPGPSRPSTATARLPLHGHRELRAVRHRRAARRGGGLHRRRDDTSTGRRTRARRSASSCQTRSRCWSPTRSPASRRHAKSARKPDARPVSSSGPNFVDEGDMIRVDTRTGEYQTRARAPVPRRHDVARPALRRRRRPGAHEGTRRGATPRQRRACSARASTRSVS